MNTTENTYKLRRKIWYITVIILSGLILLITVLGVAGNWFLMTRLSDFSVAMLGAVDRTAGGVREVLVEIDMPLAEIQRIADEIIEAGDQLSASVADRGLVMTLLPQEQTEELTELINTVQDTLTTIKEIAYSIVTLYRSIDSLPFVSLPGVEQEQIESLEEDIHGVSALIDQLSREIDDFRTNSAARIEQFTEPAAMISKQLEVTRGKIDQVDGELARLQDTSVRLQKVLPTISILAAIVITLFLAFVAFTQVELIRLYLNRLREFDTIEGQTDRDESSQVVAEELRDETDVT